MNIWLTDVDMQFLAASPPISPLVKKYEKDSVELILQRKGEEREEEPQSNPSVRGIEEIKPQKKRKKKKAIAIVQSIQLVDESEGKRKRRRRSSQ